MIFNHKEVDFHSGFELENWSSELGYTSTHEREKKRLVADHLGQYGN